MSVLVQAEKKKSGSGVEPAGLRAGSDSDAT